MADVVLQGIEKKFGSVSAITNLNLEIKDGAFVILLGPTGAGKTTTLRLIAGLDRPDNGDIKINGHSVVKNTPAQRNVAMVFQQYSLYPHMSVRDNLAFPLRSPTLNFSEADIKSKVNEVAEVLQIRIS